MSEVIKQDLKTEALKLALEALEHEAEIGNDDAYRTERDAIREALAEQDDPDLQDKDPELVEQHYKQVVDDVRKVFNAKRETLPAQQQEPVAVYVGETWCGSVVRLYEDLPLETPLYTSPPASKPLTGILSIAYSGGRVVTCSFKTEAEAKAFEQYAIEVAHQIGVNK